MVALKLWPVRWVLASAASDTQLLTSITSIRLPTVWRPSSYDASKWTSLCWSSAVELAMATTIHIAPTSEGHVIYAAVG